MGTSPKKDMVNHSALKRSFMWLVTGCRVVVGILVLKAGVDLMGGATFTGYNRQDSLLVGGFVAIIGLYFVFSSLFHVFFKDQT
ncbi:MAG: hypothetical protein KJ804_07545 [Proteobacteria bacterium]|nr:hypothetical protein [Pseudomonadota bacterium]MBU1058154.1 hypothetical protein [Pseudomonadota bacterium]